MAEAVKRTSVRARVYKKLEMRNSALSDYGIYIVTSSDFSHLPPSVKAESSGRTAYFKEIGRASCRERV